MAETILTAIFLMLAGMLYLLPTLVAKSRFHRNTPAIFVVNLLLGWTFIGWVGALAWAMTSNAQD